VPQHTDALLEAVKTFLRNQATTSAVSFAILLFFSGIAFRMLEEAVAAIFRTHTARAAAASGSPRCCRTSSSCS